MSNKIVNVNLTQTVAPTPSTLQQTGAFISQGGTTLTPGTMSFLTQLGDLAAIIKPAAPNASLSWSGSVVTVTTASPHGLPTSTTQMVTIAGVTPSAYNGTYLVTSVTTTTFTYALGSNPGTETIAGTWQPGSTAELNQMATSFFGMGSDTGVYVLELGFFTNVTNIATLSAWIAANPNTVYSYLVPRSWDAVAQFTALAQSLSSTTAKTYFFVTTTNATYTNYTALMKSVLWFIESPNANALEFQTAAMFQETLGYNPSSTNKVTPLAFSFLYGVTPYPTFGNNVNFTNWKAAAGNWAATGSEGGINLTILLWGTTADGNPFNYWYAADWMQINIDLNISNAVMNGSNNPINPLYLNQDGINRLQAVGASTISSGVAFGMVLGQVVQTELAAVPFLAALETGAFAAQAVINAIPFLSYYRASPGDYKTGTYNGFSVTFTPLRGFQSITFNVNVTTFVSQ